ncbi:hypothetical protein HNR03_000205 [Pseudomonas sp. JAI111]|nr:hypothetical protein [Pseudomonas sp. JAI111]
MKSTNGQQMVDRPPTRHVTRIASEHRLAGRSSIPKNPQCYAVLFYGGTATPNSDMLPSLLFKINQNQLAIEAAIMELTIWVEQHGAVEVAGNVRGALEIISKNEEFINMTLAILTPPSD